MQRYRRKLIILVVLLAIGALAWHFDLFRAGDCLREGGKWNADGGFCRLDRLAIPPQMQDQ